MLHADNLREKPYSTLTDQTETGNRRASVNLPHRRSDEEHPVVGLRGKANHLRGEESLKGGQDPFKGDLYLQSAVLGLSELTVDTWSVEPIRTSSSSPRKERSRSEVSQQSFLVKGDPKERSTTSIEMGSFQFQFSLNQTL